MTRFILNEGLVSERDLGKIDMVSLNAGDTVTAYLSGAGGYGDPFSRDPALVRKDVILGFVTASGAEIDYGVVIKVGEVDESATATLRAGRTSPRPVDFDYGEEREAWESVFDDERMVALNRALVGHAPAQRQRIRKTIFGSIDERLLVPATEKRHDFRDLMGEGDEIAVSFEQLLSAIPDAAT